MLYFICYFVTWHVVIKIEVIMKPRYKQGNVDDYAEDYCIIVEEN